MKNKKLSLMLAGILAFAMNGQMFGSEGELSDRPKALPIRLSTVESDNVKRVAYNAVLPIIKQMKRHGTVDDDSKDFRKAAKEAVEKNTGFDSSVVSGFIGEAISNAVNDVDNECDKNQSKVVPTIMYALSDNKEIAIPVGIVLLAALIATPILTYKYDLIGKAWRSAGRRLSKLGDAARRAIKGNPKK